ncbi:MAG: YebC/PmpR family DNA-binding transcriptional regulator [Bacteroidia bacterium]|nr:YebC/PmpR family DNA-binding transcriptional regulator [Bacteroidia bacterium]
MGRAFEKRKTRMMARWDKIGKAFTKLGKEIAISVKLGGPDPKTNARLRAAIQNAKHLNMPKDRIEAAIKRASSKEEGDLQEMVYEGYGPHGIAILIETATDNPTRTVANIRSYFNRAGGSLGKTGSLDFLFSRKSVFKIKAAGINLEEFELEMIDHGLERIVPQEDELLLYASFEDFGKMQKALEEKALDIISSELIRIPTSTTALTEAQEEDILNLIEKIEEDDDVQAVFHTMEE